MTTHDKDKIIALRNEADKFATEKLLCEGEYHPDFHTVSDEYFYAIAFELGRVAEREEIVRDLLPPIDSPQTKAHYIANEIADALCKAIRARGDRK